jgi:hypothetical protein
VFSKEPPERFVGFGRPLFAPIGGQVAGVHDGEPDHEARRSQLALIPYAFGQASRIRQGIGAIAGNHLVISVAEGLGPFAGLWYLVVTIQIIRSLGWTRDKILNESTGS